MLEPGNGGVYHGIMCIKSQMFSGLVCIFRAWAHAHMSVKTVSLFVCLSIYVWMCVCFSVYSQMVGTHCQSVNAGL